ncbi:MAG: peptidylprolyl isomerase [Muribaculaceae bacterium]|nr:peptidylprolyl isomerase [Muribaculaceae bacterium]
MKNKKILFPAMAVAAMSAVCAFAEPPKNVVDEVAWIVGDQAIFRSDVEEMYQQLRSEGQVVSGDPYCVLPERIAVEKLYLHQAKIDTIEAPESRVYAMADQRINFFIGQFGSKEKMEEYFRKPMPMIREQMLEMLRNNAIISQVQQNLTKDVKATPNEVRKYFDQLPADSVPYVPMQVEVQIISLNPNIPRQEIEDVKARLRDYADRVNRGDADFSTLAIMYSEDGSSMQGGELGFHGRADWVPEFSNVAFNLNDPKKVSRIVETEYGYHIMQLIAKRGDQVNVRHILLTPRVSSEDLRDATNRLDSIRKEIVGGAFPFDEAARYISQDKDTRNNRGVMMNQEERSVNQGSSRFEMQELPPEIASRIEKMSPGDISEAFVMKDTRKNKDIAAIVRLTNRVPGHRANLSDDYNMIKEMYENHQRDQILKEWLENKIKDTYVRIEDGWNNCDFHYKGWVKEAN